MRSRLFRFACWLLIALHAAVVGADFLAPRHFAAQHRDYPYAPPARLHFRDAAGRFHWRPFVYALASDAPSGGYREDPSRSYPVRFLTRAATGQSGGILPFHVKLFSVDPPGVLFLLGTDGVGRDVFSRLLYGAQVSLFTGLLATALALAIGLACGVAAGFFAGWTDRILMRTGELFLALPWLYLLLAVRAVLPLHIDPLEAFFLLVGIIGSVGWVRPARLVRAVVLSEKERGFVLAARGFGASNAYLLRRHIVPLTSSVLVTQATVLIPRFVLAEVTLSFLGLGVGEPVPSWGNMLAESREYHTLVSHSWMLAPAAALVLVLIGYLVLADSIPARRDP